jgi:formamidopyrimidine-DNA glycosylase
MRSAKALLPQEQIIPGLGNSIAQDILFRAGLHPKHPLATLTTGQRRQLFDAIIGTVNAAIDADGRADEVDLFGPPGRYVHLMGNSHAQRNPCEDDGPKKFVCCRGSVTLYQTTKLCEMSLK